jgi:large subunit ribosomal protein L35
MNKPIYRHYAEAKWRSYDQRLITQRIKQFNIVPDVLPKLEPTADVQLYFRKLKIPPGQIVDSLVSENTPRLRVQVFDQGERLVSVVVLDSDVPNPDSDTFGKRCHFLAANIPISPTDTSLPLSKITAKDQLAVPWLPAFSQKGAPYHRLGIYLLEQEPGVKLDVAKLKELYSDREGFSLKSFRDKFRVTPFGFNMFRSVWDENTAAVMARHNIPGSDIEFRPTRVHSLKPPVKPRGWEAKRQGPKYRHLWKYTKNIKGISNSRGWIKKR